ncbi:MAG: phosphoglycerate dehydrogenase [Myxococcota bacterium]
MAPRRVASLALDESARVAVTSRSFSRSAVLRSELLERYPRSTFNEAGVRLSGERLRAHLLHHEAAIVGLEEISRSLIESLPELRVISKYGVGLDALDLGAMRDHGLLLGWTPGVNRRAVAELTLALILGSLRQVVRAHRQVVAGTWDSRSGATLTGKTVGIVGLGHVGRELVSLLVPFRCRVLANDLLEFPEFCERHGVEMVPLEELLALSDVVSLHVPITERTRGFIDSKQIGRMRPGAVLVNTARGEVVDEDALSRALESGALSGAAFDVLSEEPPRRSRLLGCENVIITPHIGGSAPEAILEMGRAAIAQLDRARPVGPDLFPDGLPPTSRPGVRTPDPECSPL